MGYKYPADKYTSIFLTFCNNSVVNTEFFNSIDGDVDIIGRTPFSTNTTLMAISGNKNIREFVVVKIKY